MNLWLRVFMPFAAGYYFSYFLRNVNAVIAPELTRELGISAADLGLLTAAYLIAFGAFQLPLGVLLDRYGPRRVEAGLLLIAAVGCAAFALGGGLPELALARGLSVGSLVPESVPGVGEAAIVVFVWSAIPATITGLVLAAVVWRTGSLSWIATVGVAIIAFAAAAMLLPLELHDARPYLAFLAGLVSIALCDHPEIEEILTQDDVEVAFPPALIEDILTGQKGFGETTETHQAIESLFRRHKRADFLRINGMKAVLEKAAGQ